ACARLGSETPAALLSGDLRDQARSAAPLRWADGTELPHAAPLSSSPSVPSPPSAVRGPERFRAGIAPSASRVCQRRALSEQTVSGGGDDSSLHRVPLTRGDGRIAPT